MFKNINNNIAELKNKGKLEISSNQKSYMYVSVRKEGRKEERRKEGKKEEKKGIKLIHSQY